MAKHPSVHAKVNIACDREAERGNTLFQGKQSVHPITPNEVGAVLEVKGKPVFINMKDIFFPLLPRTGTYRIFGKVRVGRGNS